MTVSPDWLFFPPSPRWRGLCRVAGQHKPFWHVPWYGVARFYGSEWGRWSNVFLKKSLSVLILLFTDSALQVRSNVLCLLLKYFKEHTQRKKHVSRGWQLWYWYMFHVEFWYLLSLEITSGIEKDRRDWHSLDLFCALFNFSLSVKIAAEKIPLLCRESCREYFNSFTVLFTYWDLTDL